MSIVRRIGVALAIAGSVIPLAAATAQRSSPGYTYRLTTTGRVTRPDGRTTDYVVMSGRALVTEKAGRLDVDGASRQGGGIAHKDSYILYDATSMTIVQPRDRQMVRLALENLERNLAGGGIPGTLRGAGRKDRGGGGARLAWARSSVVGSPAKGRLPQSISKSSAPTAYKSARGSAGAPSAHCSGAV